MTKLSFQSGEHWDDTHENESSLAVSRVNTAKAYRPKPCAYCACSGQPCVACKGMGYVMVLQPCCACSQCGGTGRLKHPDPPWGLRCQSCWGSGWQTALWIKSPKVVV